MTFVVHKKRRVAKGYSFGRSKFGNIVCRDMQGNRFDSKFEMQRFYELQLLERIGEISGLERQVPFVLTAHGVDICKYVADFVYYENGLKIVEDAKGVKTDVFNLKSKLFRAQYGFNIRVTYAKDKRKQ